MRYISKLIAASILIFSFASQTYAWGSREQGIVAGIAGTLLWQHITQPRGNTHMPQLYPATPMVPYYPGTVYYDYTYRPMYKAVDIFIPECNCYRTVMVQIN
jgi:hypothetical protein